MGCEAISGSILTPSGWIAGTVETLGWDIARVTGEPIPCSEVPRAPLILPGFIDLHVHGGGGFDWRGGEEAIRGMARFHAARGTVAMAPTTSTAPIPAIEAALASIDAVRAAPRSGEAIVLGAHLEGPFISPGKLGAQEPFTLAGDSALAKGWAERWAMRIATVAPEIPGGLELVRALAGCGTRVQIGHSLASAHEAGLAFGCGCAGYTHLFNAMSGMDHRSPGVAAHALAHGTHAEVICDLLHVDRTMLHAAVRAVPQLYAISDATMAGMPDGMHVRGDHRVLKRGLQVTLEDGRTLAGSAITLLDAFRNLVAIGLTLDQASRMTSMHPARYLGLTSLGAIEPGRRATLVVLDRELELAETWIDGRAIAADPDARSVAPPGG
jgi:N-acetylglucosamine-6-phosphate deacetylase